MSEQDRERAERQRADAELERVEQEDLRQIGEGGQERLVVGEDHETGRVEAEESRVGAEEDREVAEVKRSNLRRFYLRVAGISATPVAFIALIPSLIGLYLVSEEAENRSEANRRLIVQLEGQAQRIDEQRNETRRLFRRADLQLCRQAEKLKLQNRVDAQRSYDRRGETLAILGIESTPEIQKFARENLERDLSRNAPLEGGCKSLPSVNGG